MPGITANKPELKHQAGINVCNIEILKKNRVFPHQITTYSTVVQLKFNYCKKIKF